MFSRLIVNVSKLSTCWSYAFFFTVLKHQKNTTSQTQTKYRRYLISDFFFNVQSTMGGDIKENEFLKNICKLSG